jgi:membrane protein implicated in regulation of membrane protease activity
MSSAPGEAPQNSPDQAVLYEERLWPSPWIWLIAAGFSSATIVMFAPISMGVGYGAAIVVAIIVFTLLILSTPRITVTATTLTVGRASIERKYLGSVEWFTGEDATHQRGPGLHGLAYLCIRGWISPVVKIEVTDPEDRTPYWLASSRTPERLVAALAR